VIVKQKQEIFEKRVEIKEKSMRIDNLPRLQLQYNTIISGCNFVIDQHLSKEQAVKKQNSKND